MLQVRKDGGWNLFMQAVFRHMHSHGVTQKDYDRRLEGIPFVDGMKDCLHGLQALGGEVIIISDSNSYFISHILEYNDLGGVFHTVYTNPAEFDGAGLLTMRPFHVNADCALSGPNLCKGKVLKEHVRKRLEEDNVEFGFVGYAGDGGNDFCPMSGALGQGDLALPRDDGLRFSIMRHIRECKEGLKAEVVAWNSGAEVLSAVERKVKMLNQGGG